MHIPLTLTVLLLWMLLSTACLREDARSCASQADCYLQETCIKGNCTRNAPTSSPDGASFLDDMSSPNDMRSATCDGGVSCPGLPDMTMSSKDMAQSRDMRAGLDMQCRSETRLCGERCMRCPAEDGIETTTCSNGQCVLDTCASTHEFCNALEATCCPKRPFEGGQIDPTNTLSTLGDPSVLVVDGQGHPHIAYRDNNMRVLFYTRWEGTTWTTPHTFEAKNVGDRFSLVLDSTGSPHLAFQADPNEQTDMKDIMHAWIGPGGWQEDRVVRGMQGQEKSLRYPSLALDSADHPHVVFQREQENQSQRSLVYWHKKSGKWTFQKEVVFGVGNDHGMTIDKNDQAHLAYRISGDTPELLYCKLSTPTYKCTSAQKIDAADTQNMALILRVDQANEPHVAYYRGQNLHYARLGPKGWTPEMLPFTGDSRAKLGFALDRMNQPHISYSDSALNLHYTKKTGTTWAFSGTVKTLATKPSLDLDPYGRPYVSYQSMGRPYFTYQLPDGSWD